MKEIITIQCGSAANYVGSHFWNILDASCAPLQMHYCAFLDVPPCSYALQDTTDDASVMFRASSSGASTGWHPRVVAIDSKAGFGAMTAQGFIVSDSGDAADMACARLNALNDRVAARGAAAASLWGGGIEVIEQESVGLHAFTRHMLTCHGEDDGCDGASDGWGSKRDDDDDDADHADHDDGDDDDDGSSSQRKSAKKKFAALQQQMLGGSESVASSAHAPSQVDAVNMEELNGGLLDESVRYWTDFQQVTQVGQGSP